MQCNAIICTLTSFVVINFQHTDSVRLTACLPTVCQLWWQFSVSFKLGWLLVCEGLRRVCCALRSEPVTVQVAGVKHCLGVDALDTAANAMARFVAPVTLLATGGAGQVLCPQMFGTMVSLGIVCGGKGWGWPQAASCEGLYFALTPTLRSRLPVKEITVRKTGWALVAFAHMHL